MTNKKLTMEEQGAVDLGCVELKKRVSYLNKDFVWSFSPRKGVEVFIIDTKLTSELVCSRPVSGPEKIDLFASSGMEMVKLLKEAVFSGLGSIFECVIQRGGAHFRPDDFASILKNRKVSCSNWTMQRVEVQTPTGPDWRVEVKKNPTNLDGLSQANSIFVWEDCAATGSTLAKLIFQLRQQSLYLRRGDQRIYVFVPFLSNIAYWRLLTEVAELDIKLTLICFGIYDLVENGWDGRYNTDIVIPQDAYGRGNVLIPNRQVSGYWNYYKPNFNFERGPCLVGDVGESTGGELEVADYVRKTGAEINHFCSWNSPAVKEMLSIYSTEEALVQ